ncbi:AsnC family transcriptional regulator [Acidovorax sp. SRB_14]|uniref:siroheme decarboxylase subunit beta n=1 Tax=Acidovorax sp. SRB_14 TaxID=1962699 RepID=UPI001565699D|nr:Lrp/AsnC family transcriptional regulator [Acidovorax sp. SRB_14]NMM80228.1 AsnC family transcriptional regulator [Acidovorax sp. SRB_14]
MAPLDTLQLALLNPWQRGFPLVRDPFHQIAQQAGMAVDAVLAGYAQLQASGALSRIGGVFAGHAGGAALLAAMAVPPERLCAVAAQVSAHPGVNHNYEREHRHNLWFVMTGHDDPAVRRAMAALEQQTGLPALQLRMERAYRIDLGFDLRSRTAPAPMAAAAARTAAPVAAVDRPLAALLEGGVPLEHHPFDAWAQALGRTPHEVLQTLQHWLDTGTLRRLGAIVRHHELGFDANAMTVFDVPDAEVDACGEALARAAGVTLAYRRARAAGWPYNLYCMVHGRDRAAVLAVIERVTARSGLAHVPREVLFSRQRFKQTGPRRFRALPGTTGEAHALSL